jgi:hypothetical protein
MRQQEGHIREVEHYLRRKYDRHIVNVLAVQKEDLELVCVSFFLFVLFWFIY